MRRGVSRADRARDAIALAILVVGAALWGYGFLGLREMAQKRLVTEPGRTAVERATTYWNFSRVGTALIIVGVVAVGWSFWVHYRRRGGSP